MGLTHAGIETMLKFLVSKYTGTSKELKKTNKKRRKILSFNGLFIHFILYNNI